MKGDTMEMLFALPAAVLVVITALKSIGARTYVMGGALADYAALRTPVDFDLETHNVTTEMVMRVLEPYKPHCVGSTHPAIRFMVDGVAIDVSVAQRDAMIESQHRDLTINSPFYDPLTRELFDPFNGMRDSCQGMLAATSAYYADFPVNVLRTAQFLARGKGTVVNMETTLLATNMSARADTIPAEQVFAQLCKLLRGATPFRALEFLRLTGWHEKVLPEVADLTRINENQEWHPEGPTAWDHTIRVVEAMCYMVNGWPIAYPQNEAAEIPEEWREPLCWAALLHDVGKAHVESDAECTFKGHDRAGEEPARALLERLKAPKDFTEKVIALVVNHMQPYLLTSGGAKETAWRRLHNKVPLHVLRWISRADWSAHPNHKCGDWGKHLPSCVISDIISRLPAAKIPAVVQGRDLVAAGVKPGPHMKTALDAAYNAQLENPDTEKNTLIAIALAALN
jgi:tRNA nucleotidyltransferase (CCA-adding enzyme)